MATLNISMPDEMRAFIEARVSAGNIRAQVTIFVISSIFGFISHRIISMQPTAIIKPLKKPLNPFLPRRIWAHCTMLKGHDLKESVSSVSVSCKTMSSIIGNTLKA